MTLNELYDATSDRMSEDDILDALEVLKTRGMVREIIGADQQIHYLLSAKAEDMSISELIAEGAFA